MARQIVLDTETTGLSVKDGHRIIEIGCVELINRRFTGNNLHFYFNPGRVIDEAAISVHGITNEFLIDKPRFVDKLDEMMNYLSGAELIIHNAAFDIAFINYELELIKHAMWQEITRHCQVLDTLLLARQQNPGQRNSLDALCKRYDIDNSHRQLHGALLDAEILGRVYLAMTGGQTSLLLSDDPSPHTDASSQTLHQEIAIPRTQLSGFAVVKATETETAAHADYLKMLAKASGGEALWQKLQTVN